MSHCLNIAALLLIFLHWSYSIVNPNNESANMVIYLQKPSSVGPRTWLAGVNCLDQITRIFFRKRENLTRSPNIVMTIAKNMSTPAAQIQEAFLKVMMDAVSELQPVHKRYQMRIVSDGQRYFKYKINQRELVLADYYIIVTDSLLRLDNLLLNYVSHMLSWNPGARFLILYNNATNRNSADETATTIFKVMLEHFYIHRVGLLYATSDTRYVFMVLDYFSSSSCRQIKVKQFAECQDGKVVTKNLAALQRSLERFLSSESLTNCTFFMCASISAPFVESDCVLGLEMRIIGFIKTRLNFNIIQNCEHESRGIQEESGNWTGLLGRLNEKSCDFIMGGFYPDNEIITNFWVSDTYLEDSYTWYVKLADPRPAWMALYSIFQDLTWAAFIVMLLITWLTWFVLVYFLPEPPESREWSLTGINSMAVSICVSVNERPLCVASRFFFISLALYGLNVTSTYTSKLISVFSNPGYLHQIDTLAEVVEAGIPFGGNEENRDWFDNDEDYWVFDKYNDSADFEPLSINLISVERGERVILSRRMYIMQSALADNIFAFKYNVFSSPMQMIMKAGFPFLYDFNMMIRYMRDFGFLNKIHRDFVYNNTYLNRIDKMRPDFKEKVIVLRMDHLQGAFSILTVGIFVSIGLFLGELLAFYICVPWWTKSPPKKRQRKRANGRKRKRNKSKEEIVIYWNEIYAQKDVRLTPLKRRIVKKQMKE
ncbi:ionotropic receptor 60a [Musca autumnalis]|uniref:ionotropic receptor 60a n=1 Tax=Musca autumnalis TaxID=221902 RepID=UPI003CFADE79